MIIIIILTILVVLILYYNISYLNFLYAPASSKSTAPKWSQIQQAITKLNENVDGKQRNTSGKLQTTSSYYNLAQQGYIRFNPTTKRWVTNPTPGGQPAAIGYKPESGGSQSGGSGGKPTGSGGKPTGSGGKPTGSGGSGKPTGSGGSGKPTGSGGSGKPTGSGGSGKPTGSGGKSGVKPPPKGGVSNMGWSDDGSSLHTKPTEAHVIINTAGDSPAVAAEKVAALKDQGKYVNGYLNLGRLTPDEHKDMYKEIADGLKKIGKSINGVTKSIGDKWNERWITPQAMTDPKVRETFMTAWKNEIQRMGKQGYDAINLDNVDYYQSDNGGGGKEPTKAQLNQAVKIFSSVADTIHKNGMAAGWKNAPEIAPQMVSKYDFVVTEQMFQSSDDRKYSIPQFSGFVKAGKPIYNFEVEKKYYGEVPQGWASYNKGGSSGYQKLDVNI
jgi:hypothetical protein